MNSTIKLLGLVLIIQAALYFALDSREYSGEPFQAEEKLLSLDFSQVNNLVIKSAEDQSLVLNKQDSNWVLPESHNFPASTSKINSVVEKLLDMKKSWPVATTAISARQFKVAADSYEKKLSFLKDQQELQVIYFGTSPGFKKVHMRVDGSDDIYAVDFASYELPMRSQDWNETEYLKINSDDIESIEIPAGTLIRKDQRFEMQQGNSDVEESNAIARAISDMTFLEVLGTEDKEEYGLKNPALQISLKKKDGSLVSYSLAKPEGASSYYLKRADLPYYFKVMTTSIDRIKDYQPEPPTAAAEPEGSTPETGSESNG